jgi:hypothetical protein
VTKDSKTLIDHIYITNLEILQESHVVQYSVSDHYPVCMTRSEQISVKKDTHISIVYRNYKKIVESEFLKDLSYAQFNNVEYVEDTNSPHIKFIKFISHLSCILNFCITPVRLFISFSSFCYNWCMFI